MAAVAGIDLGFEGEGAAWVTGEMLLLGELVKNLVENAIAYAGRGAEVTVRVASSSEGVRLEVEDNGPGIPPEKRVGVMQRFVRGERERAFGTGLGLPIVEEIAGLYGATVTLEDGAGGRGLKVSVLFPAISVDDAA